MGEGDEMTLTSQTRMSVDGFCKEHEDGEKRWVFTSELEKVKIKGDLDAYITLVDDDLYEISKIRLTKYPIVSYSQIKFIPRIIEATRERNKILKNKTTNCYKMLEELKDKFQDVFGDKGAVEVHELTIEKKDGYTKEYVSHVLDNVNKRNGLDWSVVS